MKSTSHSTLDQDHLSQDLQRHSASVFLQEACLKHRYIRSRDTSTIVERPERLRAVAIGLAAAIARLEGLGPILEPASPLGRSQSVVSSGLPGPVEASASNADGDELAAAMKRMNIASSSTPSSSVLDLHLSTKIPIRVVRSSATVTLKTHAAIDHIHGDSHPGHLHALALESTSKISEGQSEIPDGLSQGDLYLCPGSTDAIEGAVGTVCEAVDTVIRASAPPLDIKQSVSPRAFVAIRPPGHHCGEDTPSGFCFVNNVAVAAAHAHLQHGIRRVVIFDIDLHHGNGTQAIAWQINEETYRLKLEAEAAAAARQPDQPGPEGSSKPGLQFYYSSVHDVLSFPCEDGKAELVQAASVSIHGPHGQYIENVHLEPYESEDQFWDVLYKGAYSRVLRKAEDFLKATGGDPSDTLVFISCGFDASEHEHASMSRHARKVPTGFYYRFTKDACAFADRLAQGRIVSVLEGGYSDKALLSGTLAHIVGMSGVGEADEVKDWWSEDCVNQLEKLTKRRRKAQASNASPPPAWLGRAAVLLQTLDPTPPPSSNRNTFVPPKTMTLRNRKKAQPEEQPSEVADVKEEEASASSSSSPSTSLSSVSSMASAVGALSLDPATTQTPPASSDGTRKKLPRVILKVRPPAEE